MDDYESRSGGLLLSAQLGTGYTSIVSSRHTLQDFDWPTMRDKPEEIATARKTHSPHKDHDDWDSEYENTPSPEVPGDDPDDKKRMAKFQMLRDDFNSIRSRSRKSDRVTTGQHKKDGLDLGILSTSL